MGVGSGFAIVEGDVLVNEMAITLTEHGTFFQAELLSILKAVHTLLFGKKIDILR